MKITSKKGNLANSYNIMKNGEMTMYYVIKVDNTWELRNCDDEVLETESTKKAAMQAYEMYC